MEVLSPAPHVRIPEHQILQGRRSRLRRRGRPRGDRHTQVHAEPQAGRTPSLFLILFFSVADPGCLSRIWIFPIPDPDSNVFHPGSRIRNKEFKYFNLNNFSKLSEIWSGLFIPDPDHNFFKFIPNPGSRGQKGTGCRIPDPHTQHCFLSGMNQLGAGVVDQNFAVLRTKKMDPVRFLMRNLNFSEHNIEHFFKTFVLSFILILLLQFCFFCSGTSLWSLFFCLYFLQIWWTRWIVSNESDISLPNDTNLVNRHNCLISCKHWTWSSSETGEWMSVLRHN